jgi:hypothetical protein
MSHLPQRKEKNCLNCGTKVIGKYCHNCGQENTVPEESVWHLVMHFFNDITHFDGKFFTTLKDLLFKPGFLSSEYMMGKRMKYLNPVRMYIFTSFIFFLIFFSLFHFSDKDQKHTRFTFNGKTEEMINALPQQGFDDFTKDLNNGVPMTHEQFHLYMDSVKKNMGILFFDNGKTKQYDSREQYDSAIATGKIKDGWLDRLITYRVIDINSRYHGQNTKLATAFINSLLHHFPQILFVSLPFVALFLKLLYIRRKKFYYVSHAIFSIHFYIFFFIAMLVFMLITKLKDWLHWTWMNYINIALVLLIFFYLYKAMRNFYKQRRGKTLLKYFLFCFSFLFLIVFLFTIFALISVFQI